MHIVSLIGEQAAPALIVLRTLAPEGFTLLCTNLTVRVAKNIKALVTAREKHILEVPAYNFQGIVELLKEHLHRLSTEIAFDLTGGTKVMALAAYDVARDLHAPVYYLRSQREQILFRYTFVKGGIVEERITIPESPFDLRDYFAAYLGPNGFGFIAPRRSGHGGAFESAVEEALRELEDLEVEAGVKIGGALELDLAFRRGSSVGVAEVKTGRKTQEKRPLEQLNAACGREFLGTYTKKVLIIDRPWGSQQQNLRDLAAAWGIKVIELPSFGTHRVLSHEDKEKLWYEVTALLERG